MKIIIIDISPTGETKITTKGYTGANCRDGSRFIEQALGNKTAEQLTPEYHKQPTGQQVTQ